MWKYLAALLIVLLSMGGLAAAQPNECTDCYANIVTQLDIQNIDTVRLAITDPLILPGTSVAVGNEGLSAGIIVTKPPVNPTAGDQLFVTAPFARIDQMMNQRVSNLGSLDINLGDGAKGITWNKAIQAAWVANQGVKELENTETGPAYTKEGSWISQSTTQLTNNTFDYDSRESAKVLNVDNKLAMIVDDVNAVLNLTANANSASTDSQASNGTIIDGVEVTIAGYDPEKL
jgi:hypothetical protein